MVKTSIRPPLLSSEFAGQFLKPPVQERQFKRLAIESGVRGSVIGKRKLFWTWEQIEVINDYRRSKPTSRL